MKRVGNGVAARAVDGDHEASQGRGSEPTVPRKRPRRERREDEDLMTNLATRERKTESIVEATTEGAPRAPRNGAAKSTMEGRQDRP